MIANIKDCKTILELRIIIDFHQSIKVHHKSDYQKKKK